jgi:hypothetical protein
MLQSNPALNPLLDLTQSSLSFLPLRFYEQGQIRSKLVPVTFAKRKKRIFHGFVAIAGGPPKQPDGRVTGGEKTCIH